MATGKSEVRRRAALRRWREADARFVIDALEASGQSVAEFARAYDLDPQRLWHWRKRIRGGSGDGGMEFAPVVVTGLGRRVVAVARVGAVEVEVVDPSAVDPRWVAALLSTVVGDRGDGC